MAGTLNRRIIRLDDAESFEGTPSSFYNCIITFNGSFLFKLYHTNNDSYGPCITSRDIYIINNRVAAHKFKKRKSNG